MVFENIQGSTEKQPHIDKKKFIFKNRQDKEKFN